MAIVNPIEDQAGFDSWVASRPPVVQALIAKLPPGRLYLLKSSGHRVTIYSYAEDSTVTVDVLGKYNLLSFERRVFGIKPEGLEECDLPPEGEPLGAVLTKKEDVDAFVAEEAAKMRKLN